MLEFFNDENRQRRMEEAELHHEEDKKKKEVVEARNQADSFAYGIEKALAEHGERLAEGERAQVQAKLDEVRSLLKDPEATPDRLHRATEELKNVSLVFQRVYEDPSGQAAGAGQRVAPLLQHESPIVRGLGGLDGVRLAPGMMPYYQSSGQRPRHPNTALRALMFRSRPSP